MLRSCFDYLNPLRELGIGSITIFLGRSVRMNYYCPPLSISSPSPLKICYSRLNSDKYGCRTASISHTDLLILAVLAVFSECARLRSWMVTVTYFSLSSLPQHPKKSAMVLIIIKWIVAIIFRSYLYTIISIFKPGGVHDGRTGFYLSIDCFL